MVEIPANRVIDWSVPVDLGLKIAAIGHKKSEASAEAGADAGEGEGDNFFND